MAFELHPRLAADSSPVCRLGLCEARLMNDARWPWVVLIPRRQGARELHDLAPGDLHMLIGEAAATGCALRGLTGAGKINTAALGNIVEQLHVHIVARRPGDANWPGPVWGCEDPTMYEESTRGQLVERLRAALAGGAATSKENGP